MVAVGFFLTLQHLGGFFEQWRARGIATFDGGFLDPRFAPAVATLEAILGGSLVGKWSTAWALIRFGDPIHARWVWRALFGGLVGLGLFEAFVVWSAGIPFDAMGPELASPMLLALLLWRLRRPERVDVIDAPRERPLAWRALEAFAWMNVALGLVLSYAVKSPPFAIYREAMSDAWFEGAVIPHGLGPWFNYGFGAIGAVFAAQFFMLAMLVRFAPGRRWAWWTYGGTVLAWFIVDSASCLVHGATFNVLMVNLPALAGTVVLLAWARASVEG